MKKKFLLNVLVNAITIFVSYLLAVVIRYRILRSEPGIDALSLPYLMLALTYSFLIAFTFDYTEIPRWLTDRANINGFYQILSKNAIGCLLLLAALYVMGIVHFSRWALFIFWALSSLGLIVKRAVQYGRVVRKRFRGEDIWNVIVIGDGKLTENYIGSITENPQFGIRIIGYFGNSDRLSTNIESLFNIEGYSKSIINWLGEYTPDSLLKIISKEKINEIVIAEDNVTDKEAKEVMLLAAKHNIKTSLTVHCAALIREDAKIRNMGRSKQMGLNEDSVEKSSFVTGLVVTVAVLFLLLIVKRFYMGAMDTIHGFDNYRSVIFGLFAFFCYMNLHYSAKKHKVLWRSISVLLICAVCIVIFEFLYENIAFAKNIKADFLAVFIVTVISACITAIEKAFSNDLFFM